MASLSRPHDHPGARSSSTCAASVAEATGLLAELGDDAVIYAGGTELLLLMKLGFAAYGHLVDVKRIDELHGIRVVDGTLRIGAAVTHRQIERSPLVLDGLAGARPTGGPPGQHPGPQRGHPGWQPVVRGPALGPRDVPAGRRRARGHRYRRRPSERRHDRVHDRPLRDRPGDRARCSWRSSCRPSATTPRWSTTASRSMSDLPPRSAASCASWTAASAEARVAVGSVGIAPGAGTGRGAARRRSAGGLPGPRPRWTPAAGSPPMPANRSPTRTAPPTTSTTWCRSWSVGASARPPLVPRRPASGRSLRGDDRHGPGTAGSRCGASAAHRAHRPVHQCPPRAGPRGARLLGASAADVHDARSGRSRPGWVAWRPASVRRSRAVGRAAPWASWRCTTRSHPCPRRAASRRSTPAATARSRAVSWVRSRRSRPCATSSPAASWSWAALPTRSTHRAPSRVAAARR